MEDDEVMDVELEEKGDGSLLPIIACILAVIGIGVGGTGLYIAFQGTEQLTSLESMLETQSGQNTESMQALKTYDDRLTTLETDLEEMNKGLGALKTRMRMDRDSNSDAIKQISQAINANRQQINQNIKDIAAIPEQVTVSAPVPPPEENTTNSSPSNDSSPPAEGSAQRDANGNLVHTIEAGDYFGKLAREYGVSLTEILNANPTANPDRLQIGQKVIIPVKE